MSTLTFHCVSCDGCSNTGRLVARTPHARLAANAGGIRRVIVLALERRSPYTERTEVKQLRRDLCLTCRLGDRFESYRASLILAWTGADSTWTVRP